MVKLNSENFLFIQDSKPMNSNSFMKDFYYFTIMKPKLEKARPREAIDFIISVE
jgi:hypothetical protein